MKNYVQVGLHVQKSTLVYIIDNDSRIVGHYAVYIRKDEPTFRRSSCPHLQRNPRPKSWRQKPEYWI